MKYLRYIFGSTALLGLSFIFVWNSGYAITSYNVTNEVQMYLDKTITTTTATGIVLASPKRNGSNHTFGALTGGVLRIRQGSKVEDIYYALAEVRSDNTVNLQGVVRDLCTSSVFSYVTCGNGRQFSRGSIVELNVDQRIINLKANLDRPSRTIGSGAYICGYTGQPCLFPGTFTTTQRDAFTYTNSNAFHLLFNSTTGTAEYYNPTTSGYSTFGSGSTVNATLTAGGKVQLTGTAGLILRTATGSTGAPNVPTADLTTMTGGLTSDYGRIPILNVSGLFNSSIGGTGTGGSLSMSGVLITNGTGAMNAVYGVTEGNVLKVDANGSWVSGAATTFSKTVYLGASDSSGTGASSTAINDFNTHTYNIPANDLISGVAYEIEGVVDVDWVSGATALYIEFDGTQGASALTVLPAADGIITFRGVIRGTAGAGASVAVRTEITAVNAQDSGTANDYSNGYASTNLATNGILNLHMAFKFDDSNAGHLATLKTLTIKKISTTGF